MFLKKTPKAKGTYLAITESYYDKEKKATRQKTIMGLGYLEDLKKDYPDPISHFEKVVADMNQEREAKKNSVVYVDLTTALSPGEHSLKNVGYGILKYLYKELQLDIFWRTRTWNLSLSYNIEELFRYMVISRALYPNCTWNEAIEKGLYFEESGSISDEDLDSAFHVIVKICRSGFMSIPAVSFPEILLLHFWITPAIIFPFREACPLTRSPMPDVQIPPFTWIFSRTAMESPLHMSCLPVVLC